jgi:hypothetical protein
VRGLEDFFPPKLDHKLDHSSAPEPRRGLVWFIDA